MMQSDPDFEATLDSIGEAFHSAEAAVYHFFAGLLGRDEEGEAAQ